MASSPYANPFGDNSSFGNWWNLLNGVTKTGYAADTSGNNLYGAFTNLNAGGGPNSFLNWLQGQQGRYWGQYQSQSAQDPTLQWSQFLQGVNPGRDYSTYANFYDRGDQPGFKAPTDRMVW